MTRSDEQNGTELLGSFTAMFEHGTLVVRDPDSQAAHDDWTGDPPVDARSDSICIAVMPHSLEGDLVAVEVLEYGEESPDYVCCFDGRLTTRFGTIMVHDSDELARLTLRLGNTSPRVRIEVDKPRFARRVRVIIDPL